MDMSHIISVVTEEPLLHLGSNVITDGPLLHLGPVITLVPFTRNPDPRSEFGLRGNQTFSLH